MVKEIKIDRAKVVDLYQIHHLSTTAIAARFGVNAQKIRDVLRDAGIEVRRGRAFDANVGGTGRDARKSDWWGRS